MARSKYIFIVTIYSVICFLLLGCDNSRQPPPLEFTPQPAIITQALQLQLDKEYEQISKQLNTDKPQFTITKIKINKITPTIQFKLPTYHLEGNYQITLQQKNFQRKKISNNFQLDLQRQLAGKTWRLIVPEHSHQSIKYHSYKIQ